MVSNQMDIKFKSISSNNSFARAVVGAFLAQLDPTVEQIYDIKMAVSEAVTNAIIHGYNENEDNWVELICRYEQDETGSDVVIEVIDTGCGIENLDQARCEMFSSTAERAGLGFTVMEAVVDKVDIMSKLGEGTRVALHTRLTA
ncbi:MAG: anti-sigma F factor [Epulopiscium sp. Nuni2H_MBin003]|nr:MAG: anti-sigma F factor [Epulopiscium sp. Nuni2H_MBin003]